MTLKAIKEVHDADVLVRKRTWHATGKTGRWSEWQDLLKRSELVAPETTIARRTRSRATQLQQQPRAQPASKSFQLPLGGTFTIFPNLLSSERQKAVTNELMQHSHLFRQYRIQGGPEPRAHFLLHSQATNEDFDSSLQPGYKYGTISMKARPLSLLPRLEQLSNELTQTCGVDDWNVGINPVFYRDARDYIGLHADNDQGEDCILTVLVKSPTTPRAVIVQTLRKGKSKAKQDGDEQYLLLIGAGDGYSMDGIMQQFYVHGVPSCLGDAQNGRIALVLRHGTFARYTRDSGQALDNVEPRVVVERSFGRIVGLVEGDSYSRSQIRELGAHLSPQGGISGNKTDGCDAIIVTDAREDGLGEDRFDKLMYAAETRVGAASILTSMRSFKRIRVFRSSAAAKNVYKSLQVEKGPTQYRYDGLYRVSCVLYFDEHGEEKKELPDNVSLPVSGRLYQFQMERIQVGEDTLTNEKSAEQLMEYAIQSRTIGHDARVARPQHELLQWPMSIVTPRPSRQASDQTIIRVPESLKRTVSTSKFQFGDVFGDVDRDGLPRHYSDFPTPVFERQPRFVSPSQIDCSASSLNSNPSSSPETLSSDVLEAVGALMSICQHNDTPDTFTRPADAQLGGAFIRPVAFEEATTPAAFQVWNGKDLSGARHEAITDASNNISSGTEYSTRFETRQDVDPVRVQSSFSRLPSTARRGEIVSTEEHLERGIGRKRARLNRLLYETHGHRHNVALNLKAPHITHGRENLRRYSAGD